MLPIFVYGTLCDRPLLERILGRRVSAETARPARLTNHGVWRVAGHNYPMIAEATGSTANGVILSDLSENDLARLKFYECGYDFDVQERQIETDTGPQSAQVFFPRALLPRGEVWVLADWQARWGQVTRDAAGEAMGYFGQRTGEWLKARMPVILRRAYSRILAKDGVPRVQRSAHDRSDVSVTSNDIAYSDFFAVIDCDLIHRRFDGDESGTIRRACFIGFDAAIVLPYDPVRDRVLLVEQFRIGAYLRGDPHPWTLEPVAGHVDTGETPLEAARREAREEAGLELDALEPIARTYPSPGCSSEYYHIFLGLCDLPDDAAKRGGLDGEGEDILGHLLSFDALMRLLDTGEAENGPLVLAALWLAANRTRLRGA